MIATQGDIRRNTTQENVVSITIRIMIMSTVCVNPIAVTFAVIALENGLVYEHKVRQCECSSTDNKTPVNKIHHLYVLILL